MYKYILVGDIEKDVENEIKHGKSYDIVYYFEKYEDVKKFLEDRNSGFLDEDEIPNDRIFEINKEIPFNSIINKAENKND